MSRLPHTANSHYAVWKLIATSQKNVEAAKGQNLVLLIGATGAGKSSLINYLNGSEMQREV